MTKHTTDVDDSTDSKTTEQDCWGGITEYWIDGNDVVGCYAYRLFGDEWVRIELLPHEKQEIDTLEDVPDGWTLVGVAENHPEADDRREVVAIYAPFYGNAWGTVQLSCGEPGGSNDE